MKVCGENADCVVTDSHRVALSPNQQPLHVTVTEQSLSAEVSATGKTKKKHPKCGANVPLLTVSLTAGP